MGLAPTWAGASALTDPLAALTEYWLASLLSRLATYMAFVTKLAALEAGATAIEVGPLRVRTSNVATLLKHPKE
jgi:hypothetical protein